MKMTSEALTVRCRDIGQNVMEMMQPSFEGWRYVILTPSGDLKMEGDLIG